MDKLSNGQILLFKCTTDFGKYKTVEELRNLDADKRNEYLMACGGIVARYTFHTLKNKELVTYTDVLKVLLKYIKLDFIDMEYIDEYKIVLGREVNTSDILMIDELLENNSYNLKLTRAVIRGVLEAIRV